LAPADESQPEKNTTTTEQAKAEEEEWFARLTLRRILSLSPKRLAETGREEIANWFDALPWEDAKG